MEQIVQQYIQAKGLNEQQAQQLIQELQKLDEQQLQKVIENMQSQLQGNEQQMQFGGKKTFEQYRKSLPLNLQDTTYYNLRGAYEAGLTPEEGHLPSRSPKTGEILKYSNHPTFNLGLEVDKKLGYYPYIENSTGKIYTFNKKPDMKKFSIYKNQYGGELKSLNDDYFDNPLRSAVDKIKNTPLYQDWLKIDKQYPTAKDKLSALTALTSLAPHPYIKYGSIGINTALDLMGDEMNDKVDLASNVMQIAGKKHQLPLRIAGQVLGTNMDIINPSDDKFKVRKKQYGGTPVS